MHAINLGRARAGLGQIEEAIASYRAAIKINPNLEAAYFELAELQHRGGRLEDAESTYRKLLRAIPDNTLAKLRLAWVLMEVGKPGDAETMLRRTLGTASESKIDNKTEATLCAIRHNAPP